MPNQSDYSICSSSDMDGMSYVCESGRDCGNHVTVGNGWACGDGTAESAREHNYPMRWLCNECYDTLSIFSVNGETISETISGLTIDDVTVQWRADSPSPVVAKIKPRLRRLPD